MKLYKLPILFLSLLSLLFLSSCSTPATPANESSSEISDSSSSLLDEDTLTSKLPSENYDNDINSLRDTMFVKGKERPILSMEEAWGDAFTITYLDNFLNTYGYLGYAPILENGDFPVLSGDQETEAREMLLYNVNTHQQKQLLKAEPGTTFSYSGNNEKYLIAYTYEQSVYAAYHMPLNFIIYDKENDEITELDLSAYQYNEKAEQYIHPFVTLYHDEMYFEMQDRPTQQNQDGITVDYGLSAYSYNFKTKEVKKVLENAATPLMTDTGLYFMDKSSDLEGGSVYFLANGSEKAEEIIPNCGEFIYDPNIIFFTRDYDTYQSVYSFKNGVEKELFQLNDLNNGWSFFYNGRLLCWSRTESPLYAYDAKLDEIVLLSDITGARSGVPSSHYVYWNEITDENAEKGKEDNRIAVLDISKLMQEE